MSSERQTARVEVSLGYTTSNVRSRYVMLRVRDVGSGDRLVNVELEPDQFMQLLGGGVVSTEATVER